jgi:hypothetical protein
MSLVWSVFIKSGSLSYYPMRFVHAEGWRTGSLILSVVLYGFLTWLLLWWKKVNSPESLSEVFGSTSGRRKSQSKGKNKEDVIGRQVMLSYDGMAVWNVRN